MFFIDSEDAVKKLSQGEIVAIPTETVYGLAAPIDNEESLKKIFSVKQRPFFDPLIVHVKDLQASRDLAQWDPTSLLLAKHFWPGPLTFVLQKQDIISDLITSGGPTVALRSPAHNVAQEILEKLGTPLAAPSANRFGHTSPTDPQHVLDEFKNNVSVVDGGSCEKGIESTILEVNEKDSKITILRPGVITENHIKEFLKSVNVDFKIEQKTQKHAPGHLKNHYQPTVPFLLLESEGPFNNNIFTQAEKDLDINFEEWNLDDSPEMAARQLYSDLREFSNNEQPLFLAIKPYWKQNPDWIAILDRLHKACHFYLKIGKNGSFSLSKKDNSTQ